MEKIVDHRGEGVYRQYLIKWKNSEENSWFSLSNLFNYQEVLCEYLTSKGLNKELQALDKKGELKNS